MMPYQNTNTNLNKAKRGERKQMVKLYTKPAFYDTVAWKEEDLLRQKDKITETCIYMTQKYINQHYASGGLTDKTMEDLLHDVLMRVLNAIDMYKTKELDTEVPFWPYIYNQIVQSAKDCYQEACSRFGEAADTHREAKRVRRMMEEEHLTVEEVAARTGHKKTTVQNYLLLTSNVDSLDKDETEYPDKYQEEPAERKQTLAETLSPLLQDMDLEERFIIETYLSFLGQKDFRRKTEQVCKERGISGRKMTLTIRKFKKKI